MNTEYQILLQIMQVQNNKTYCVPCNYFENLSARITLKIKAQQNIYQVPNNYFTNLSSSIINKIQQQNTNEVDAELETIAPVLNSISKQNIYQIPANYFENLTYTNNNTKAKIVSINKTKWYKYIAAASIIFIAVFWVLMNNKNVNKEILAQHKQAIKTNVNAGFANIADAELNKTIGAEKSNLIADETTQINLPFLGNVEAEVELITDEEMEIYFKNNNTLTEETTITNS